VSPHLWRLFAMPTTNRSTEAIPAARDHHEQLATAASHFNEKLAITKMTYPIFRHTVLDSESARLM